MTGTVPVRFALSAATGLRSVLFGQHRHCTDAAPIRINGIDIDLAGFEVREEQPNKWRSVGSGRCLRRANSPNYEPATDAARIKFSQWAVIQAPRVAETNAEVFEQARSDGYATMAADARKGIEHRKAEIARLEQFAELAEALAASDATVNSTPRGDNIRWNGVGAQHHDRFLGRAVKSVGNVTMDGEIIGLLAAHATRPGPPLAVPVALIISDPNRSHGKIRP